MLVCALGTQNPRKWRGWVRKCIRYWMMLYFIRWIRTEFTHWQTSCVKMKTGWSKLWISMVNAVFLLPIPRNNYRIFFFFFWFDQICGTSVRWKRAWHDRMVSCRSTVWHITENWRRIVPLICPVTLCRKQKLPIVLLVRCYQALQIDFRLDELLEGGLLMSNLIDICGPSIAGKTQLCTTIAINLATLNEETLWIDTKADFSARRIYKILKKRKCSDSEIRAIMQRIRIDTCNEPNKLIQMIEQLVIGFDAYKKAKLLVIDSLPALWFLFHGEHRISGCVAMTRLTNHLRKLAIECGMIILIVNLATQYFPGESGWCDIKKDNRVFYCSVYCVFENSNVY